ncbi:hypothetical protein PVAP13_3NG293323 [Panicum virgatum]|uniref:Uncharacterized protein n=1 Tax=Panicum virgatum TaxID=38727 RepID=A0A8T0UM68_PANVG|nr:hypothetical protein PVAP13_3NG293323 [Panicum virgatum]
MIAHCAPCGWSEGVASIIRSPPSHPASTFPSSFATPSRVPTPSRRRRPSSCARNQPTPVRLHRLLPRLLVAATVCCPTAPLGGQPPPLTATVSCGHPTAELASWPKVI